MLFDGLNELPRKFYQASIERLNAFRKAHPGNRFIFTCRKADYTSSLRLDIIQIEPLDDHRIWQYLEAYLPNQANAILNTAQDAGLPISEIGSNPYMLRMIVAIFEERGTLPSNRAELFGEFVGALLRRERLKSQTSLEVIRHQQGSIPQSVLTKRIGEQWPLLRDWELRGREYGLQDLNESEKRDFVIRAGLEVIGLARLAFAMSNDPKHGTVAPFEFAVRNLSQPVLLGDYQIDPNATNMLDLAQSASLLERVLEGFRFTHQLIQEYFAAIYVASGKMSPIELSRALKSREWSEVFVLVSGLLVDPSRFVDALISNATESWQVFLAARCILEGNRVKLNQCKKVVSALADIAQIGRTPADLEKEAKLDQEILKIRRETDPIIRELLEELREEDEPSWEDYDDVD